MKTDELMMLINQYFDGEMDKSKEPLLFTELSQDAEAREHFKELNLIKSSVQDTFEEFPFELERRILYSLNETEVKEKRFFTPDKFFATVSYVAATVLIQLPPTTTRFLSFTESTSESLTTRICPPGVPPPGVTTASGAVTNTSA